MVSPSTTTHTSLELQVERERRGACVRSRGDHAREPHHRVLARPGGRDAEDPTDALGLLIGVEQTLDECHGVHRCPARAIPRWHVASCGSACSVTSTRARPRGGVVHFAAAHVMVLSVGDVVDGPGDVERCVRLLMDRGVLAVRGNHDRWIVRGDFMNDAERLRMGWTRRAQLSGASFAWLASLPATRTIETARGPLLLCHGVGDDDMKRFEPHTPLHDCDEMQEVLAARAHRIIVGGHTHERMARVLSGVHIINAGTLTDRGGAPCFALLDVDAPEPRVTFVDF
jgi:predicted phosphodiesterase